MGKKFAFIAVHACLLNVAFRLPNSVICAMLAVNASYFVKEWIHQFYGTIIYLANRLIKSCQTGI